MFTFCFDVFGGLFDGDEWLSFIDFFVLLVDDGSGESFEPVGSVSLGAGAGDGSAGE